MIVNHLRFILFICIIQYVSIAFCQSLDTTSYFASEKLRTVNTSYHEGHPVVTADGNTLYFFVTNHPRNNDGKEDSQDIWYSVKNEKGEWGEAQHMDNNLNRRKYNEVLSVVNDGKTLLLKGGKSKKERGMSISHFKDGEWGKPEPIHIDHYAAMNVGRFSGATMNNDMSVIIHYFSEAKEGKQSSLYVSFKKNEHHYTQPEKLNISSVKDDFGPFITFDGEKMYFSSTRDGGLGDADIYISERLDDSWKNWSKPKNIGAPVNTSGFDAYFSMDFNNEHAYTTRSYISRDGGSLDILGLTPRPEILISGTVKDIFTKDAIPSAVEIQVLKKGSVHHDTDDNGNFGEYTLRDKGVYVFSAYAAGYEDYHDTLDLSNPGKNKTIRKEILLTPLKPEVMIFGTVYDKKTNAKLDADLVFKLDNHPDVKTASNPQNGYYRTVLHDVGEYHLISKSIGYDVYKEDFIIEEGEMFYEVHKDIYLNPGQEITLMGYVRNEENGEPIEAKVQCVSNDGTTVEINTNPYGYYEFQLVSTGEYRLLCGKEGFLNFKKDITIPDTDESVQHTENILLTPIKIGATVRLNEIYFDTDKSDLRPESFPELDRVVDFMETNPRLRIEISGHTDDRGSDEHNMTLSDNRAKAVREYLVKNGVHEARMKAKGYGETMPEVQNTSDKNRQQNRRVQFTILSK